MMTFLLIALPITIGTAIGMAVQSERRFNSHVADALRVVAGEITTEASTVRDFGGAAIKRRAMNSSADRLRCVARRIGGQR